MINIDINNDFNIKNTLKDCYNLLQTNFFDGNFLSIYKNFINYLYLNFNTTRVLSYNSNFENLIMDKLFNKIVLFDTFSNYISKNQLKFIGIGSDKFVYLNPNNDIIKICKVKINSNGSQLVNIQSCTDFIYHNYLYLINKLEKYNNIFITFLIDIDTSSIFIVLQQKYIDFNNNECLKYLRVFKIYKFLNNIFKTMTLNKVSINYFNSYSIEYIIMNDQYLIYDIMPQNNCYIYNKYVIPIDFNILKK